MGLAGTMALGVLAACFQNKYLIEVAPGWEEPLNLYTTAVAGARRAQERRHKGDDCASL